MERNQNYVIWTQTVSSVHKHRIHLGGHCQLENKINYLGKIILV